MQKNGVVAMKDLIAAEDGFLEEKLGMALDNIRELKFAVDGSRFAVWEASDGFRGTYNEVLAHEEDLKESRKGTLSIYEAPDGFRGTLEEVEAHERQLGHAYNMDGSQIIKLQQADRDPVLFRLYEASDGFRGVYDEVLEHEKRLGASAGNSAVSNEAVLFRIYESELGDGFRGTLEEVDAHEKKARFNMANGITAGGGASEEVLFKIYESDLGDGFRGTLEEVEAHEKKVLASGGAGGKYSVFEAPDGFRGTYQEVDAHEKAMGLHEETLFALYECDDGFRGTQEECVAHEEALKLSGGGELPADASTAPAERVLFRIYEAPDGFRGTYEEVVAHEKKHGFSASAGAVATTTQDASDHERVLFRLYESELGDGFTGTFEEVEEHEKEARSRRFAKGGAQAEDAGDDEVLVSVYEAPDGFRGTYEEVEAHERKIGHSYSVCGTKITRTNESTSAHHDTIILRIYECEDGFRGSYDECLAHEEKLKQGGEDEVGGEGAAAVPAERVLFRIYEAPDGFRGTYEEVMEYEKKHGFGVKVAAPEPQRAQEPVLFRIYESDLGDGFFGTFEEVEKHEKAVMARGFAQQERKKAEKGAPAMPAAVPAFFVRTDSGNLAAGNLEEIRGGGGGGAKAAAVEVNPDSAGCERVMFRIYESADGFRGTYEEVVAHEEKVGLRVREGGELPADASTAPAERVLFRIYEAPDGFRGTYEEVVAHERGRDTQWDDDADDDDDELRELVHFLKLQGLGRFSMELYKRSVRSVDALKGCDDDFLEAELGLKKAHALKLRRGLEMHEAAAALEAASVYDSAQHFLVTVGLGQYGAALASEEVESMQDLALCSAGFLVETIGMKPAHGLKLRLALEDAHMAPESHGVKKRALETVDERLMAVLKEHRLTAYVDSLHVNGVNSVADLCARGSDAFLEGKVGARGAHLLKFRRAIAAAKPAPVPTLEVLLAQEGLGHFELPLHQHGIVEVAELKACTDEFLRGPVEMGAAHTKKLRRALTQFHFDTAPPVTQFCSLAALLESHELGAFTALFAAHRIETVSELRTCSDLFLESEIGLKPVHRKKLLLALEAEAREGAGQPFAVYECPRDGFRGSYHEVAAHEAALDAAEFADASAERRAAAARRLKPFFGYEAADGFVGAFEDVVARQQELAAASNAKVLEEALAKVAAVKAAGAAPAEAGSSESKSGGGDEDDDDEVSKFLKEHTLGRFIHDLKTSGVASVADLRGLSEEFLVGDKVGMKKAHLIKFRRGLSALAAASPADEADDEKFDLYEAADGFRGTYEQVLAHERSMPEQRFELYQAPDGFLGSYDDVVAHEKAVGLDDASLRATLKKYVGFEASDGFIGTHEAALDHELALAMAAAAKKPTAAAQARAAARAGAGGVAAGDAGLGSLKFLGRFFFASDGSYGTYEQARARERAVAEAKQSAALAAYEEDIKAAVVLAGGTLYRLTADGYEDTHEGVLAHAAKRGLPADFELCGAFFGAADGFRSASIAEAVAREKALRTPAEGFELWAAADGFHGTRAEVVAHEANLDAVVFSGAALYSLPDGFVGNYEEALKHEADLAAHKERPGPLVRMGRNFVASDGFTGPWAAAKEHEASALKVGELDHAAQVVLFASGFERYRGPSGVEGTYEEVVAGEAVAAAQAAALGAYKEVGRIFTASDGTAGPFSFACRREAALLAEGRAARAAAAAATEAYARDGFAGSAAAVAAHDAVLEAVVASGGTLYRSTEDGFEGTYEEVAAHHALVEDVMARGGMLYACREDGFRGTYEEVAAHVAAIEEDGGGTYHADAKGYFCEAADGFRGTLQQVLDHVVPPRGSAPPQTPCPVPGATFACRLFMASNGFMGTFEEALGQQRSALARQASSLFTAPDGFLGTYAATLTHERAMQTVTARGGKLYECTEATEDGAFRGTYEEVAAHAAFHAIELTAENTKELGYFCEASDGFRGTLAEAVAREAALFKQAAFVTHASSDGTVTGSAKDVADHEELQRGVVARGGMLYTCSDSFRGNFEECSAHVAALEGDGEVVALSQGRYCEASDGSRGTFADMVAREAALVCGGRAVRVGPFFEAPDGYRGFYAEALARTLVTAVDHFTLPGSGFVGTAAEVAEYHAAMEAVAASGVMVYKLGSVRGTFEELKAYEAREATRKERLGPLVRMGRAFVASDGFTGPWAAAKKHEASVLKVGELDDAALATLFASGFERYMGLHGFTGTFEAVTEHLRLSQAIVAAGGALYECDQDGFRGTYEEVVAHEAELGLELHHADKEVVGTFCQASDGFRGKFKEVLAREMALVDGARF